MDKKIIEKLEEREEICSDWLENYREAQKISPNVQKILDETKWELDALRDIPEEAQNIPFSESIEDYKRRNIDLKQTLKMIPRYNTNKLLSNSTSISASASSTYNYLLHVGEIGTHRAQDYSDKYTQIYIEMRERESRIDLVNGLIRRLNDKNIVVRYKRALEEYNNTKTRLGERTAAALEMRNLMDGIKGILWQKAKNNKKENMTWEIMSKRLTEGDSDFKELLMQEKKYTSLKNRLSGILKDREGNYTQNLDNIWVEVLDLIDIVLNFIKI